MNDCPSASVAGVFIYNISSYRISFIHGNIYTDIILNYETLSSLGISDNFHHFEIKMPLITSGRLFELWNKGVYEITALASTAKE